VKWCIRLGRMPNEGGQSQMKNIWSYVKKRGRKTRKRGKNRNLSNWKGNRDVKVQIMTSGRSY